MSASMQQNHQNQKIDKNEAEKSDFQDDIGNIAMLLFLYILQAIPIGISYAIPILLQNRGATYAEQAGFTVAFYPFTMKILWAPIVDSVYLRGFGRRKSWLVPTQFLIGGIMIYVAGNIDDWMGDGGEKRPQMVVLTSVFFLLWFFTATQDIAVDGWALTMLQKKNIGYASTCNAVGSTAGYFTGYTIFLILDSKDYQTSVFSLSSFLHFWGIIFLITTVMIAVVKREDFVVESESNDYGVKNAYPMLWKILKLKPVIKLSLILFTVKASFSACDEITTLKLIEFGVPKDKIAILSTAQLPLQLILPFVFSRSITGEKPMDFYIKAFPFRLLVTVFIAFFVYVTPFVIEKNPQNIPNYYYWIYVLLYLLLEFPYRAMYVADTAFMARISDPLVGGTYMTLLNTISNFGGRWAQTFYLWLVDIITWKSCILNDSSNSTVYCTKSQCEDMDAKKIDDNIRCHVVVDGYYIEVVINVIYGIIWYQWGKRTLNYLQNLERKDWLVFSDNKVVSKIQRFEGSSNKN